MFVDVAKVLVKAGDGGDGIVSFRHEKFVDKGGPDGGDGGDGGSVIFVASRNQNTLASFRFQKEIKGTNGSSGAKRKMHGRSGQDVQIKVPVGTVITDIEGNLIDDLAEDGQKSTVAKGGKGGFGNAHFTSSTRQAPRVAEKGEKGETKELVLELKMIADVGLVGLPNAGKSTLLSVISNAKPEIANYPFTTTIPNLGVVDIDKDNSLLFADIPGLIEGASKGKGLGDEFLRHVERTRVLVHLIDAYNDDPEVAYKTIIDELKGYKIDLSNLPQVVLLSKVDGLDEDIINDQLDKLKNVVKKGTKIMPVSSKSSKGLKQALHAISELITAQSQSAIEYDNKKDLPTITLNFTDDAWKIKKSRNKFIITGSKIERFAARTDFENYHGIQRLRDIMRKMGLIHELERSGIEPGQYIQIGKDKTQTLEY